MSEHSEILREEAVKEEAGATSDRKEEEPSSEPNVQKSEEEAPVEGSRPQDGNDLNDSSMSHSETQQAQGRPYAPAQQIAPMIAPGYYPPMQYPQGYPQYYPQPQGYTAAPYPMQGGQWQTPQIQGMRPQMPLYQQQRQQLPWQSHGQPVTGGNSVYNQPPMKYYNPQQQAYQNQQMMQGGVQYAQSNVGVRQQMSSSISNQQMEPQRQPPQPLTNNVVLQATANAPPQQYQGQPSFSSMPQFPRMQPEGINQYPAASKPVQPHIEVCGFCEKPNATVKCIGECSQYFHQSCVEQMPVKTVHQAGEEHSEQTITCQNCIARIQKCVQCQEMGQMGLTFHSSTMIKCAVSMCRNYFHKKCADTSNSSLPEKVRDEIDSPVFICGTHHCHLCYEPFKLGDMISRCIKCVAAYHHPCMFELQENDGIPTRISKVSIIQVSPKHFICYAHQSTQAKQGERKTPSPYVDSEGNTITYVQGTRIQDGESTDKPASLKSYYGMHFGLKQAMNSGELIKPFDLSHQNGKSKSLQLNQGPPSSVLSSSVHWRRLDPSETIVLNQATILRVNELIQSEKQKRLQPDPEQDTKKTDNQNACDENDTTQSSQAKQEEEEKSSLKASDILKMCHRGISKLNEKKKLLKKRKYEEFLKFVEEEYDPSREGIYQ